jgi:hypothetical protein
VRLQLFGYYFRAFEIWNCLFFQFDSRFQPAECGYYCICLIKKIPNSFLESRNLSKYIFEMNHYLFIQNEIRIKFIARMAGFILEGGMIAANSGAQIFRRNDSKG